jgi:Lactate dehydrogenase and related dehydrogenases
MIELAEASDILLCLLPGGDQTKNAISTPVLEALGREGILINLGRGISINEEALTQALLKKTVKLACLDVYQNEPNIPAPWRELDNIILLPHIGSATVETRRKMGELVLKNVEEFILNERLISEVVR